MKFNIPLKSLYSLFFAVYFLLFNIVFAKGNAGRSYASSFPTISSVVATPLSNITTPNNSGYFGQTITINGSKLNSTTFTLNGITITPVSNSGSQLVFIVPNTSGTSGIVITNSKGSANAPFVFNGYITNQNGDWNVKSTWLGGNVPPDFSDVTIKDGVILSSDPPGFSTNLLVTVNGSLNMSPPIGTANMRVYQQFVNNGSFTMANNTSFSFQNGSVLDNGSALYPTIPKFVMSGNSTMQFNGNGVIKGIVVLNILNIGAQVTFNNAANNSVSITAILQINTGGSVVGKAPVYMANSKLVYNTGNSVYAPGPEWSSSTSGLPGYPFNIDICQNATANLDLSLGTKPTALGGTLHIYPPGILTLNNSTNPLTVYGDFIMDASTQLSLSTQAGGDLNLNGNWDNKGNFIANNGSVVFNNKSADQYFYGETITTFNSLTIDKGNFKLGFGNTASGNKTHNLLNSLNVISGTFDMNHNNLVLKSSASQTASINTITGTVINADNITAERYFPAHRSWRLLSVPLLSAQTINTAWQEGQTNTTASTNLNSVPGYGMLISGPQGNLGFDYTLRNSTSMKTYNSATDNWDAILNTNATKLSSSGAYMVYLRGSRAAGYDPNQPSDVTILRTTGKLVQGDQVYSIPANQYTLIGNPYPCAIDFSLTSRDKNILGDKFILWDTNLTGNYGVGGFVYYSWTGNSYSSTATSPKSTNLGQYIQSGQAFFVEGGPTTTPLTIKENCKVLVNTAADIFSRVGPRPTEFKIDLSIKNSDNSYTVEDGTVAVYGDKFSNGPDLTDVAKINNIRESIYLQRGKDAWAIEARKRVISNDTLFVKVNTYISDYLFTFLPQEFNQKEMTAFLIDNFNHSKNVINLNDTTFYKFSVTRDPLSYSDSRFMVVFNSNKPPFNFLSLTASAVNKKVNLLWSVENQSEIKNYEVQRSVDGIRFKPAGVVVSKKQSEKMVSYNYSDENIQNGIVYYRIKGNVSNGDSVFSKIVNVIVKGTDEISVYPNPITNGIINIRFSHFMKGNYQISLVNGSGVVVFKKVELKSESGAGVISFSQSMLHGKYLLHVVKPDGSVWSGNVIY